MEASNYVVVPVMVLTACACLAAAWTAYVRRRAVAGMREPALWGVFATVFILFVVMKAEGVTAWVEEAGRSEARAGGLYGQRHLFQLMAVLGVALVGVVLSTWLAKHVAKRWARYRWALIGTGIVFGFGVVRLVSLHEIDALGGVLMMAKGVVETMASGMVVWAALRRMRKLRAEPVNADVSGAAG